LGENSAHELLVSQRRTLKGLTHFRRGYFEAKFTEYSFKLVLATLNIVSAITSVVGSFLLKPIIR